MNYWILKRYTPVVNGGKEISFLHGVSAASMDHAIKLAEMEGGDIKIGSHTPSLYMAWSDGGYVEIRQQNDRPDVKFDSIKDETIPPKVRDGFVEMPPMMKF